MEKTPPPQSNTIRYQHLGTTRHQGQQRNSSELERTEGFVWREVNSHFAPVWLASRGTLSNQSVDDSPPRTEPQPADPRSAIFVDIRPSDCFVRASGSRLRSSQPGGQYKSAVFVQTRRPRRAVSSGFSRAAAPHTPRHQPRPSANFRPIRAQLLHKRALVCVDIQTRRR
ncbi:hypothetical protein SRHO_G00126880 [Serrasalmus rhombeus]